VFEWRCAKRIELRHEIGISRETNCHRDADQRHGNEDRYDWIDPNAEQRRAWRHLGTTHKLGRNIGHSVKNGPPPHLRRLGARLVVW
jgi:hypothetical protein